MIYLLPLSVSSQIHENPILQCFLVWKVVMGEERGEEETEQVSLEY